MHDFLYKKLDIAGIKKCPEKQILFDLRMTASRNSSNNKMDWMEWAFTYITIRSFILTGREERSVFKIVSDTNNIANMKSNQWEIDLIRNPDPFQQQNAIISNRNREQ